MPNKPRVDLRLVAWRIPIELAVKVRKRALALGIPERALVVEALSRETDGVELTTEDVEAIFAEVKANERKRNQQ